MAMWGYMMMFHVYGIRMRRKTVCKQPQPQRAACKRERLAQSMRAVYPQECLFAGVGTLHTSLAPTCAEEPAAGTTIYTRARPLRLLAR